MNIVHRSSAQDDVATIIQIESIDDVAKHWKDLELNSENKNFFLSWEWIGSWLELVLPVTKVYFFSYKNKSEMLGACFLTICSVTRKKGMVRLKQLQMNEYLYGHYNMVNGYSGILVKRGNEQAAWNHLFSLAQSFNKTWDEFFISSIDEEQRKYCEIANGNQLACTLDKICYVWKKTLPGDVSNLDGFVETFKRKSRQQLRQTIKAFSDIGPIALETAESLEQAEYFFQLMDETHTRRWQAVGKMGSYANTIWAEFHRKLIKRYFADGLIQLLKISVGDQPVGYLYGHVYRNKVYMHQTGFPQLDDNKLRSGYLSHLYAMLFNANQGLVEYDFLPDFANSYKKFFIDAGEEIVWLALRRNRMVYRWEMLIEKLKQLKQKRNIEVNNGN